MSTQNELHQLIKKYEGEILTLLNTKEGLEATDPLYALIEIAVLNKQDFVFELRGIL